MNVEWQPIENAPRDGTCIIVWPPTYHGVTSVARYDDNRYAKKPKPYWHRVDDMGVVYSRHNPPTHFMPVLEGPKEGISQ